MKMQRYFAVIAAAFGLILTYSANAQLDREKVSTSNSNLNNAEQQSGETIVYEDTYMKFAMYPSSDDPTAGVLEVFPDGIESSEDCTNCGVKLRFFDGTVIKSGGVKLNIEADSLSEIENQVGTVIVQPQGLVTEIAFSEIIFK